MNEPQSMPKESKMDVKLGLAAGDGLNPLLKAMDRGEINIPIDLWRETYASVTQVIAEVHFGTNSRINDN